MQKFEWMETFELRVPEIDGDHRVMLALMKNVRAAAEAGDRDQCEHVTDRLVAFSRDHFEREQAFIERHGYPSAEQHAEYHRGLLDRTEAVRTACRAVESLEEFQDCCEEMMSFLIDDVVRGDMKLKSFLKEAHLTLPE